MPITMPAGFDSDRDALLSALPQFGIGLIVNPGCDLPSSQMAVELARRYDHVYAAVGFHPSDMEHFSPDSIDQLRVLAQEPKVVAIGEIGLDYYWEKDPAAHEVQKEALRLQMALAQELDLPVIFHDREAHGDSLAIVPGISPGARGVPLLLRQFGRRQDPHPPGLEPVLHRFRHL